MAPRPRYPDPLAQLVDLAVDARRRRLSFEAWWEEAVRPRRCVECGVEHVTAPCECGGRRLIGPAVVMTSTKDAPAGALRWPSDPEQRHEWVRAVNSTRAGWRRAYERDEPTAGDRALRLLARALSLDPSGRERVHTPDYGVPADEAVAA